MHTNDDPSVRDSSVSATVPEEANDVADDLVVEEVLDEEGEERSCVDKLKKVRAELALRTKERDEYLAGWQRAKADGINARKLAEGERARNEARAQGKVLRVVIEALDAFAQAQGSASWSAVAPEWREGVERIFSRLESDLVREGVETFGAEGEDFSPFTHECMSVEPASSEGKADTIARVLQKGYRVGGEVVRPAKVVVFQEQ